MEQSPPPPPPPPPLPPRHQATPPPPPPRKRPQSNDSDDELFSISSDAKRIAAHLNNARAMAGKTLQRWTAHTLLSPPQPLPPTTTTPSASNANTTCRSLEVDDNTLSRLAARTPGCLFDDRFLNSLQSQSRSNAELRITEVQFPQNCGLTLENSEAFGRDAVYVTGFSSGSSPALLSGAVQVGDLILGASSPNNTSAGAVLHRWLPKPDAYANQLDSSLTDFSDFCREHRPLTIRFLTLTSPIPLAEVHEDLNKAALWMQFLTDAPSRSGETEQDDSDMYEGRILARFAIDARAALRYQSEDDCEMLEILASVVSKHLLPHARSTHEQELIDWHAAWTATADAGEEFENCNDILQHITALLHQVIDDVESALQVSYFPRFLHSALALEMFRIHSISPQTTLLRTYWDIHCGILPLESVLKLRTTSNLLLGFALQRYKNIHQKILLWIDTEFVCKPLVERFDWVDHNGRDDVRCVKQIWFAARQLYDRFLAKDSVCFCGQLREEVNQRLLLACLAVSPSTLEQVQVAGNAGGFAPLQDAQEDLTSLVATFRELLQAVQTDVFHFLFHEDKFYRDFCSNGVFFHCTIDAIYGGEISLPRFGALMPSLPMGVQDHRGAVDFSCHTPLLLLLVKGVVIFGKDTAIDVACAERLDLEGLRKFAFPWHSKQRPRVLHEGEEEEEPNVIFPFVIDKSDGMKMFGISMVRQANTAVVLVSDWEAVFDLLHSSELFQSDDETAQTLLDRFALLRTPYGLAKLVSVDNTNAGSGKLVIGQLKGYPHCYLPFSAPMPHHRETNSSMLLGMEMLIESLSIRNLIKVFAHMVLEKKLLLVSSRYTVLTMVGETLCNLLAPLKWSHVYAPLLPRKMLDLLMCPTPFLLGIHRDYAFKSDFPFAADLCVVDLDWDEVNLSDGSVACHFPQAMEDSLFVSIKTALSPQTRRADKVETSNTVQASPSMLVQQVFRKAMVQILEGLPKACFSIQHQQELIQYVDESFWLRNRPAEDQVFLSQFARTQHFSGFAVSMESASREFRE